MAYTAASIIPSLELFQWSQPGAPNPRLSAPVTSTTTTLTVTNPPLDRSGNVIGGNFLMGGKNAAGYTETMYVPSGTLDYDAQSANFTAGDILTGGTSGAVALIVSDSDSGSTGTLTLSIITGTFQNDETITDESGGSATVNGTLTNSVSADGLTLSNVVRGVRLTGLDFFTGDSSLAVDLQQDAPVYCNISAVEFLLMVAAMQGNVASGGPNWIIGRGKDEDITVSAANGDTNRPFWQYDSGTNQWIFSNDGVSSTPFGTGAGVTAGDGIDITAGEISLVLNPDSTMTVDSNGLKEAAVREFELSENLSQFSVVKVTDDSGAKIAKAVTTKIESKGGDVVFDTGDVDDGMAMCSITGTNKVVVVYGDGGASLDYCVGKITGDAASGYEIEWGTVAQIAAIALTAGSAIEVLWDSANERVVCVYGDTTNTDAKAIVGEVSGTVITWGTAVQFDSDTIADLGACYDSTAEKVLITYRDVGNSNRLTAIVGTVAPATNAISFGSAVDSGVAILDESCPVAYSPTDNASVVVYGISTRTDAQVITISGTVPTFAGADTVDGSSGSPDFGAIAWHALENKFVFVGRVSTSFTGYVGSISAGRSSWGSGVQIEAGIANTSQTRVVYNAFLQKVIVVYPDTTDVRVSVGTISGTSTTWTTPFEIAGTSGAPQAQAIVYNELTGQNVVAWENVDSTGDGTSAIYTAAGDYPDNTDAIGVLIESGSSAETKTVLMLGSIVSGFTGETPGGKAYIGPDSIVSSTESPGSRIGTFISDTELLIHKT